MDSWASDGFYSHFPSYSQQPNRREALAKARQLEYQTFLNRISPRKNTKSQKRPDGQNKRVKNLTNASPNDNELPKLDIHIDIDDENNSTERVPPMSGYNTNRDIERNEYVSEIEKMDLPDIFNDERNIARNEKVAEEKRLRNMQYKQELMEQIEAKQRERELQRLKEQEEEERITKKMEEQMKSVRLQDALEFERKPRCRDHHLVNIELNKPIIINTHLKKLPATVRSERFEGNAYRAYDQRKAQSDHGKENFAALKRSDKEIYNFFTNSARKQLTDMRYSHYFDLDESSDNDGVSLSQSSSTYNTYPSKMNRHHQNERRQAVCNFCKHNRFVTRSHEENLMNHAYICDACENDPICLSCRKEICVHCKRLIRSDENAMKQPFQLKHRKFDDKNDQREHVKAVEHPAKSVRSNIHTENFQQLMQTDEAESLSDDSSIERRPPYSFNIDKSSLFHPAKSQNNRRLSVSIRNGDTRIKPDSFDELKRITDEKLSKLTKFKRLTKSDIEITKAKKSTESNEPQSPNELIDEQEMSSESIFNSTTHIANNVPILRENTKRLIEFAKELERNDYNLYGRDRRIDVADELKNQDSAAQKKNIIEYNDAKTSTLTQIGAISKEMQLDRLNH